jgi:hypothetical protein
VFNPTSDREPVRSQKRTSPRRRRYFSGFIAWLNAAILVLLLVGSAITLLKQRILDLRELYDLISSAVNNRNPQLRVLSLKESPEASPKSASVSEAPFRTNGSATQVFESSKFGEFARLKESCALEFPQTHDFWTPTPQPLASHPSSVPR